MRYKLPLVLSKTLITDAREADIHRPFQSSTKHLNFLEKLANFNLKNLIVARLFLFFKRCLCTFSLDGQFALF